MSKLVEPAKPRVEACCAPLTSQELSVEQSELMAAMFKALGDPVRLRLFSKIASHPDGEACVCDIADVGVSQPTVSHHLRRLREAGLITSERRGTWIYYRVTASVLAAMSGMLDAGVQAPDPNHPAGAAAASRSGSPVRTAR